MQINAGPPVTGTDFFKGRRTSVEQLQRLIKENDVLLIGPRRTGKTSVVKEYLNQEKTNAQDFSSTFIDLEEIENLYEFYAKIIQSIYCEANKVGALTSSAKDAAKSLSNLLREFLPNGIDLTPVPGAPKVVIRAPKFDPETTEQLRQRMNALVNGLTKPFTIVLDEFPEIIWKLGQNEATEGLQLQRRKDDTRLLLEGLRTLRQTTDTRKHRVVVAGSINLKNTLEHLGLSALINDIYELPIPYLRPEEAVELFDELAQAEEFEFDKPDTAPGFISNQFGSCSPFYIQFFAERLRQIRFTDPSTTVFGEVELRKAFLDLIEDRRGPNYLLARLKKYYTTEERHAAEALIARVAELQFKKATPETEEQLFTHLREKLKISMLRPQQSELMAKLRADNLLERSDSGNWCFDSKVICSFWNYRFVSTEYLQ